MSLKIRLARAGAKKRPFYHIVIADSRSPRDGRFIERVGTYNPMLPADHADRVTLVAERLTHWLSNGAEATDRWRSSWARPAWRRCRFIPNSRSSRRRRRRRRSGRPSGPRPPPDPRAMSERLILMGVIGRPHGVRGLVRVNAYTEDPEALAGYPLTDKAGGGSAWNGSAAMWRG